jgi:hypothetical protein
MKGEYATDRQWSEQHVPELQRILEDLSPTMQTALTDGVDAVKPLRSKIEAELDNRWREHCARDPPPDLQELVRRSGGHNKITPEAWADFDQQKEDWNRRHFRQWRNTI